jgi:hypothetical protein
MPTAQERPGMFAPSNKQPTYASPQAIRVHQAQRHQQPGQVPPIRSMTAPPDQRSTGSVPPLPEHSPAFVGLRADTPQQDALRQETQTPNATPSLRGYNPQTIRSSSQTRHMALIPAWVNEINAPQPQRFRSSLLQNETYPSETGSISRTSSTTSLHQHRTPPRSDAYYELSATAAHAHVFNPRSVNTLWVVNPEHEYRLTLRLPADPPLSEDMFDGITWDADAMLDSVTGSSPWDLERFESVEEYLKADDEVAGKEREKKVVGKGEEEDFGWIRSVIRRS